MNRRDLLSALGAATLGFAGCQGPSGGGTETTRETPTDGDEATETATRTRTATAAETRTETATETRTETATETRTETATETDPSVTCPVEMMYGGDSPGEGWPRISVSAAEQFPLSGLSMDVSVVTQFNDTCPAAIRVALRNVGNETKDLSMGYSYPFSSFANEKADREFPPEINLIPIHRHGAVRTAWDGVLKYNIVPTEQQNGCWTVDYQGRFVPGRPVTIPPGEMVLNEYKVFNADSNVECLPPGEYVFEDSYSPPEDETTTADEPRLVPWQFTLTIEE